MSEMLSFGKYPSAEERNKKRDDSDFVIVMNFGVVSSSSWL